MFKITSGRLICFLESFHKLKSIRLKESTQYDAIKIVVRSIDVTKTMLHNISKLMNKIIV